MTKFIFIGEKDQPLEVGGKVLKALNEFINQVAGEDGVSIEINDINIENSTEGEEKGH
ncbi:Uncharacterised protein [Sphingobacterium multivorum]|nr:Uncharacterised protein [Sphingobacterium multivorum]